MDSTASIPQPRYRFGFILTLSAGCKTRYLNLRKYADTDPEVECVWAPCTHYLDPDPYKAYPGVIRNKLIMRRQAQPVTQQLKQLDAVMFHAFEPYAACALRNTVARWPLLVWSQDNPPKSSKSTFLLPRHAGRKMPPWRLWIRFKFDVWCLRHTSLCVPWSSWAGNMLVEQCGVPASAVRPINVGLDLQQWRYTPKAKGGAGQRPLILFVGAGIPRKGGDLLLDVFAHHFADMADLHLVTKDVVNPLPPHVTVHNDMNPNDERLVDLYERADMFVLPTRADMSPLVILEAMASGLPVITTKVAGIPELLQDEDRGFLIDVDDSAALVDRMRLLITDTERRQRMGAQCRAFMEQEYNAERNVPRILGAMKQMVQENGGPRSDKSRAR